MSKKKLLKKIVISSAAVSLVVPTLGIPITTQASQVERTMDTFSARAVDTTGFHFNFDDEGKIKSIQLDTSTLDDWMKRSKYHIKLVVNDSYHSSMDTKAIYYAAFKNNSWWFYNAIPRTSKITLEYRDYESGPIIKSVDLTYLTTQNDAYWGALAQEEMEKIQSSQTETINEEYLNTAKKHIENILTASKKEELLAIVASYQEKIDYYHAITVEKAVKELFEGNNPANAIKTTVTQAMIDAEQAKVNTVKHTAKKAELQAHINKAQAELNAKVAAEKAVKELFVSNNPANVIKTTVTQATIDAAQAKVNAVKNTATKAELQAHINKAQAELNAKVAAEKAVKELFVSNNPANTIKETVTQATIDAAQAKVNAVKDTAKKAELQAHINKAQAAFDAKTTDKEKQLVANYLVNQLYQNNEPLTDAIKATTNRAAIDAVQAQIDGLLPSAVKTDLQNKLDRARELLNIRTAVEAGI
ncbi:toxin Cry1Ac domain D-VI-related protein, partial [Paenilisteria rocourtiae]